MYLRQIGVHDMKYGIRNLEPNCQYSYSNSSEIVDKNLCIHPAPWLAILKEKKERKKSAGIENTNSQQTFACVSLRYIILHPPQNLCRPLKTFACVSLRYRKRHVVVGDKKSKSQKKVLKKSRGRGGAGGRGV